MNAFSRERTSGITTDTRQQVTYNCAEYVQVGNPFSRGVSANGGFSSDTNDGDLRRTGLVICLLSMTATAASTVTMLFYMF
jgi:hypothetical protein